jgi:hypothetical protein
MPDLRPGDNLIRVREEAVIPGRVSANPESRYYGINNLGIPDPALRAGPE